jgi:hypothetical protein
VREVFQAMIAENDADKLMHEAAIARLYGESPAPAVPAPDVTPIQQSS